jgi:hypothetical protein
MMIKNALISALKSFWYAVATLAIGVSFCVILIVGLVHGIVYRD